MKTDQASASWSHILTPWSEHVFLSRWSVATLEDHLKEEADDASVAYFQSLLV